MQLAAPSLPVTPSLPPSAPSAGETDSAARSGKNADASDSFSKLMPDDKSAKYGTGKKSKRAGDPSTSDVPTTPVIPTSWMQLPVSAAVAPVSILSGGFAATATDQTDLVDETGSDLTSTLSADAIATVSAGTLAWTTPTIASTGSPSAMNQPKPVELSGGIAAQEIPAGTISDPMTPALPAVPAALASSATVAGPVKNESAARGDETSMDASVSVAFNRPTAVETGQVPSAGLEGISPAAPSALGTMSNPVLAAELTTEQALTSTIRSSTASTPVITSAKAITANSGTRAKFAPGLTNSLGKLEKGPGGLEKNFLNTEEEAVKEVVSELGIDAAKPVDNMSLAASHRPFFAANEPDGLSAVTTTSQANADLAATAASDAHRAVDAVLTAGERLSTTNQGVNLQFNLGSAELAVRVEMRGGELHATFRTNSPELRSALATEWQAAAAQDAASPLRMVEPVFAGSNSSNLADQSQDFSSAQDRNSQSKNPSASDFDFMRSFSDSSEKESTAPSAPSAPRAPLGLNQHLHAFA